MRRSRESVHKRKLVKSRKLAIPRQKIRGFPDFRLVWGYGEIGITRLLQGLVASSILASSTNLNDIMCLPSDNPNSKVVLLLSEVAISLGQVLAENTLDQFRAELEKSSMSDLAKKIVSREFYPGCDFDKAVQYLMNHQNKEIHSIGFSFNWVLRHKAHGERVSLPTIPGL
jgi:hypothetical protein